MSLDKKLIYIIKIILIFFMVIISSFILIFCIDFCFCINLKPPLFAREGELVGSTFTYYGIFYRIEQKRFTSPFGEVSSLVLEERMFLFDKRIY